MNQFALPAAPNLDASAMEAARRRWATRAKPPGALGRLEEVAVHLAGITGQCPPPVPNKPAVLLFAGDHGVVDDGVSAWPAEITAAMVHTISGGGAAINAFAQTIGATVTVVDVGVKTPIGPLPNVRNERIRNGTDSLAHGPAMSSAEALAALNVGSAIADEFIDLCADCLIGGDMGIGNTTASAALISALSNHPAEALTGPGAGLPSKGLHHKQALIATAVLRAEACPGPLELLAELGGLEIAALAGLYIAAARRRTPFIVDGVIACAALCIADALAPGTATLAVAGHRSAEPAANVALEHLKLQPLLDLDLRLGEGTGAALAFPLLRAATLALTQMADLPSP
jgi:nicotinate-nucleotide--dimethylbenzimidazole phosphoribosyltransferase